MPCLPEVGDGDDNQHVQRRCDQRGHAHDGGSEHNFKVCTLHCLAGGVAELWEAEFSFLHHLSEDRRASEL